MTGEDKNRERIDRYLQKKLTAEEHLQFEKDLRDDGELKKAFEFYKDTQLAIEHNEFKSLKSSLEKVEKHQKKRKKNSFYLRMAAASLLLIAAIGYFLKQSSQLDHTAIFNEYYEAYPNIADPVSRSSQAEETNVYHLYEQGAYEQAVEILKKSGDTSDTARFYLGQSQLALGKVEESKESLNTIEPTSVFYESSKWYIALLYLKNDESGELEKQLQSIDSKSSYFERAQSLLEKVKN